MRHFLAARDPDKYGIISSMIGSKPLIGCAMPLGVDISGSICPAIACSTPETWLKVQLAYDLAGAMKHEKRIKVSRYHGAAAVA